MKLENSKQTSYKNYEYNNQIHFFRQINFQYIGLSSQLLMTRKDILK